MKEYIYQKGRVTIIAQQLHKKEPIHIGVAVCGKRQKYNKELGIDIARDRCYKQPIAIVPIMGKSSFHTYVAPVLHEQIRRSKQWRPRLPRIDK